MKPICFLECVRNLCEFHSRVDFKLIVGLHSLRARTCVSCARRYCVLQVFFSILTLAFDSVSTGICSLPVPCNLTIGDCNDIYLIYVQLNQNVNGK